MLELDLDKNKLTGSIPTEFGQMTAAREFDLSKQQKNVLRSMFMFRITFCHSNFSVLFAPLFAKSL
jgi:hypothetical protein